MRVLSEYYESAVMHAVLFHGKEIEKKKRKEKEKLMLCPHQIFWQNRSAIYAWWLCNAARVSQSFLQSKNPRGILSMKNLWRHSSTSLILYIYHIWIMKTSGMYYWFYTGPKNLTLKMEGCWCVKIALPIGSSAWVNNSRETLFWDMFKDTNSCLLCIS